MSRPKNRTGKKYLVVRDDLKLKGPGLYAILPFERLDIHKKSLYKIGYAMDINRRMETHHTYFPAGVYFVAFLTEPFMNRPTTRSKPNTLTRKQKYIEMEKFIMEQLKEKGASQLFSTTRVRKSNHKKWGQTEWFYTSDTTIHEVFELARKRFGGTLQIYNTRRINKTAKRNKERSFYKGDIYFMDH
jgi:hypothetical protein